MKYWFIESVTNLSHFLLKLIIRKQTG